MISTGDIETWLRANGLPADAAVSVDGEIPAMPDKLVVLARTGGPGAVKERAFDNATLQVITRDGQNTGEAAEDFSELVDAIFMGATPPITIGGRHVTYIDGGPPAFLDRDEARRVSYVAVYTLQVARSVH